MLLGLLGRLVAFVRRLCCVLLGELVGDVVMGGDVGCLVVGGPWCCGTVLLVLLDSVLLCVVVGGSLAVCRIFVGVSPCVARGMGDLIVLLSLLSRTLLVMSKLLGVICAGALVVLFLLLGVGALGLLLACGCRNRVSVIVACLIVCLVVCLVVWVLSLCVVLRCRTLSIELPSGWSSMGCVFGLNGCAVCYIPL